MLVPVWNEFVVLWFYSSVLSTVRAKYLLIFCWHDSAGRISCFMEWMSTIHRIYLDSFHFFLSQRAIYIRYTWMQVPGFFSFE